MSSNILKRALIAAMAMALACTNPDVVGPNMKYGPPGGTGGGTGGGGGGGGHEPGGTNNLSVPTIMIGGSFTGVTCTSGDDLVYPSGTPLSDYELPGSYFVQGVHTWQADCSTASSATATAEWGDNLAGDAKLKAGSPIRVELGLFDDTGIQMNGFTVIKLEPSELDRVSAYGTLATGTPPVATAEFLPARVFDAAVTFSVQNVGTGEYVVPLGTNPTAEINATGKVVYGYNLRVGTPGDYLITFVIPNVDITGVDTGDYTTNETGPDTVYLTITVTGGGGSGKPSK
jgi:hypothetical protein